MSEDKKQRADAFERVKGHSCECVAYIGYCAVGRTPDGDQVAIVGADMEALEAAWARLMPPWEGGMPLGNPVYRVAIIPADRFEGTPAPDGALGGAAGQH